MPFGFLRAPLFHHRQRKIALAPRRIDAKCQGSAEQALGLFDMVKDLTGGTKVQGRVGMIGLQAESRSETILGFGDMALGIMSHAQIVQRVGAFGIQAQRLALADSGLRRSGPRQHRQPQVHPGFLESRVERERLAVKGLCFLHLVQEMEAEALVVFNL